MTIQAKTTILFTLLTTTVFAILAVAVYYFSNKFVYTDFYKRLELRARIASKFQFEKDHNTTASFLQIQREYLERLPDEKSYIIPVTKNGVPEKPASVNLPQNYLAGIRKENGRTVFYQNKLVHYAGIFYKDETGDFLVIESATNKYGHDITRKLGNILLITLTASIIVIYSVGLYLSKRTFKPFRYITQKVKEISEGNLHLRLKQQQSADEVTSLIDTFNVMLDKLSTAFEAQNNFVSHASHELRTPLTSIIAEADYALSRERNIQDYQQCLNNILQQAEKLERLAKGLLVLAQTGFDGKKQRWEKIRIDELLFNVKENINDLLPENKVAITLPNLPGHEDMICIYGNEELVKIALNNIILNACKYSDNAAVTIELQLQNNEAILTITDKGIGIPVEEMRYIYDPFFRASNTNNFEGYGIGMPLTRNIIRMHKGSIAVTSTQNMGTCVQVTLPLI